MHQSGFIKNLSILSRIRLEKSLLLVQVYLGPENPKSTILHLSGQSLKARDWNKPRMLCGGNEARNAL